MGACQSSLAVYSVVSVKIGSAQFALMLRLTAHPKTERYGVASVAPEV